MIILDLYKDPLEHKIAMIKSKLNRVVPGLYHILDIFCRHMYGKGFGEIVLGDREKTLEILKEFYGDITPAEIIANIIFNNNNY